MTKKPKVYSELERLSFLSPIPFYWTDINGVIVGVNEYCFDLANNPLLDKNLIGKSAYDIYTLETATIVEQHIKQVMASSKSISFEEELVDIITLKRRYYVASRSPLFEDGKVIGVVGCVVEITSEKESQRLKLENEKQKAILEEQEKFRNDVDQVIHDIRSPLTSLEMLAKYCTALPEDDRTDFRNIATAIGDIANNLLNKYSSKNNKYLQNTENEDKPQPVLVSMILSQLMSDKKYQYKQSSVKFDVQINQDDYFTFINVQPISLKRALSNLINNSVDALSNNGSQVTLSLESNLKNVKVIVTDNGKGIPANIIDKILKGEPVTDGKEDGHGIGMSQVREFLNRNHGILDINSTVDYGTSMCMTFTKITTPEWIVTNVNLNTNDILIVLDDDESIHHAWSTRFEPLKLNNPHMQIQHFKFGQEALDFINGLSKNDKTRAILLSDYELLNQDLNGLQIIEKSRLARSILVTSHFNNLNIRENSIKIGTKVLPKQLATEVLITVDKKTTLYNQKTNNSVESYHKHVDLVIVDDDKTFVRNLARFMLKNMDIDMYYDPNELLENISKYPKNTKIALDNNYKNTELKGVDVAKTLYADGYTNLYILSGDNPETIGHINFATAILKTDLNSMVSHLRKV